MSRTPKMVGIRPPAVASKRSVTSRLPRTNAAGIDIEEARWLAPLDAEIRHARPVDQHHEGRRKAAAVPTEAGEEERQRTVRLHRHDV
jgi:hypothetical protein